MLAAVLIAMIFFIFAVLKQSRRIQNREIEQTITRGLKKQNIDKQKIQYNKIKDQDPKFDTERISKRVEQAFLIIKQSWSEQNMSPARAFITDGLFERYAIQFEIKKKPTATAS